MKFYFLGILLMASIFMLCGCSYTERSKETLYLRLEQDINMLDPAFIVDVDGGMVASYLYNGLVRLNERLEIIPDIAQRWEISDDGLTYRFYLRDDVYFTNGKQLTADAVARCLNRIIDPSVASPRSWIFEKVAGYEQGKHNVTASGKGFKVIDEFLFEIHLTEPFAPFLTLLTMPNAAIVDLLHNDQQTVICGTGPYLIEEWVRGDHLLLKRNDRYYGGKAHIQYVKFSVIPEDFTAIAEFENGRIDIMEIPRAEFEYFMDHDIWRVYSKPTLNTYYLGFNCQRAPFSDYEVRSAIGYAINRHAIIDKYMHGRVSYAESPVPPGLLNSSVYSVEQIPYDAERAKALLRDAGLDQRGFSATLYLSSDKEMEGVAELIQNDLKQVGITIDIRQLEWSAFKEAVAKGEADMFILSWWADYPDIENFLYPVFHSSNWAAAGNRARYKNLRFDALIEQARTTVDQSQRTVLYSQALAIVERENPWICLWHKNAYMVTQPWVKGYALAPIHTVTNCTELKLDFNHEHD